MYCVISNDGKTVYVRRDDVRNVTTLFPTAGSERIENAYMSGNDKVIVNYTDKLNRHHVMLYTTEGRILRHDY